MNAPVCLACDREADIHGGIVPKPAPCPDCGETPEWLWHGRSRCGGSFRAPAHTCPAYTLDGERVEVDDLIRENEESLSPEQVAEIRHLMPGETLHLGGGAGETFTLTRTR